VASRSLIALLILPLLSSPLAGTAPAAAECVTVEDFSKGAVGVFPPGWKPRKDEGRSVYAIGEEGGRRFLHALAQGLGIQAGREVAWDLEAYPILAWSWRAVEFPKGADERRSGTDDSVAAVYAVFPTSKVSVKSLKYVWSRVAPVGTELSSSAGSTQARVVRSGTERAGQWVEERVNVRQDYQKRFGGSAAPEPRGIAVLTDSDATRSRAQGDYGNFRVCKP
jgi:hypothetical protein